MTATCVLVSEGTSDLCIQNIARLLIEEMDPNLAIEFQPDHGSDLSNPPGAIVNSIRNAIDLYEPDLILVHRDSDNTDLAKRKQEIDDALRQLPLPPLTQAVRVIPVKKTEAWLLADRAAILRVLSLDQFDSEVWAHYPKNPEEVEAKGRLRKILEDSRRIAGWRPKRTDFPNDRTRIGQELKDLKSLRKLSSFQAFEEDLQNALNTFVA